jgi:hypothetical protein
MRMLAARRAQRLTGNVSKNWAISWNGNALTGTYTLASGLTNYAVADPDGSAPTAGNLNSHRYRHHTEAAINNGRCWVMFSSSYGNETDGGIMCAGATKLWGDPSWSSLLTFLEPQATFANNTSSDPASRLAYPACFLKKNGNLYAIICIQKGDDSEGYALAARQCNDDGSLGTPYLISSGAYIAQDGATQLTYDSTLASLLFADAAIYLRWGGPSTAGISPSWSQRYSVSNLTMVEPTTILHEGVYLRLWRSTTTSTTFLWYQISTNGTDWTKPFVMDVPNQPTAAKLMKWSDGRIALVGNAQDYSTFARDPLYLATIDPDTLDVVTLKALRQGITSSPIYAGTAKAGGASYASIDEENGKCLVSYSIHKESIGATEFLTSSIP